MDSEDHSCGLRSHRRRASRRISSICRALGPSAGYMIWVIRCFVGLLSTLCGTTSPHKHGTVCSDKGIPFRTSNNVHYWLRDRGQVAGQDDRAADGEGEGIGLPRRRCIGSPMAARSEAAPLPIEIADIKLAMIPRALPITHVAGFSGATTDLDTDTRVGRSAEEAWYRHAGIWDI